MYVNSSDGLKVRDYPSLKSNRIYGLAYGLPVKVIAIGKEETVDGITAPWVEILLPRCEWDADSPKFGWVFGGYLEKEEVKQSFKTDTKDAINSFLVNAPWRIQIEYDEFAALRFYKDGRALIYKHGKVFCKFNYKVVDSKNIRIEIPSRKVISEWPRLSLDDGSVDPNGFLDERSVRTGTFSFSFWEGPDGMVMSVSDCALHGFVENWNFSLYHEYGSGDGYWDSIKIGHQKKADAM
ncbi:MAG: SH3 domain-containing protein [Treponema sp.]|nr:SH3 domain-containing protein [Treponema sp.]